MGGLEAWCLRDGIELFGNGEVQGAEGRVRHYYYYINTIFIISYIFDYIEGTQGFT